MTRPGSGSIVTPVGFSVCQIREKDWPGWIENGSAVKSIIRAGISRALVYAEPSNPAGTAPAAGLEGVCAWSVIAPSIALMTPATRNGLAFILILLPTT